MNHTQIINLWPSLSDFASDLGVEYGTAKAMRRRGSIPSEYWLRIIDAASQRDLPTVTLEVLAAAIAAEKAVA